jgi:hypothetical protein
MLGFVSFALGKPHPKPAKFLPSIFSMVAIVDNGKPMFFDRHARAQGCATVRRNEKARDHFAGFFFAARETTSPVVADCSRQNSRTSIQPRDAKAQLPRDMAAMMRRFS